jgi:hypothetical protein
MKPKQEGKPVERCTGDFRARSSLTFGRAKICAQMEKMRVSTVARKFPRGDRSQPDFCGWAKSVVHLSVCGAKPAGMKPAPPHMQPVSGGAGFMPAEFFPDESPPTDRYTCDSVAGT